MNFPLFLLFLLNYFLSQLKGFLIQCYWIWLHYLSLQHNSLLNLHLIDIGEIKISASLMIFPVANYCSILLVFFNSSNLPQIVIYTFKFLEYVIYHKIMPLLISATTFLVIMRLLWGERAYPVFNKNLR